VTYEGELPEENLSLLVDLLVDATFRKTAPEARTPEMILVRIGMLCEHLHVELNDGAQELYWRLDALLRGGGQPLKPLD
jgi:hypothetical protein